METMIQFAGICGSLRKGSYNKAVLRAAKELLPEGVSMNIVSIADLPLYNQDLDLPTAEQRPEPVRRFREALAKADAFVVVSPEYNYSIPGVLKNAIDWGFRGDDAPFHGKPIALMGATPGKWGTIRMQNAFHNLYLYMEMKPVYKPEIFIAGANKKIDEDGRLTDETARKLVAEKLEGLKKLCVKEMEGAYQ